ncbi:hypothetical protein H4R21_004637, partial [Coemansia helicoidea]
AGPARIAAAKHAARVQRPEALFRHKPPCRAARAGGVRQAAGRVDRAVGRRSAERKHGVHSDQHRDQGRAGQDALHVQGGLCAAKVRDPDDGKDRLFDDEGRERAAAGRGEQAQAEAARGDHPHAGRGAARHEPGEGPRARRAGAARDQDPRDRHQDRAGDLGPAHANGEHQVQHPPVHDRYHHRYGRADPGLSADVQV